MTRTEKLTMIMDYIHNHEILRKSLDELKFNHAEKKIVLIKNDLFWSSADNHLYTMLDELGVSYHFSKARIMHIFT